MKARWVGLAVGVVALAGCAGPRSRSGPDPVVVAPAPAASDAKMETAVRTPIVVAGAAGNLSALPPRVVGTRTERDDAQQSISTGSTINLRRLRDQLVRSELDRIATDLDRMREDAASEAALLEAENDRRIWGAFLAAARLQAPILPDYTLDSGQVLLDPEPRAAPGATSYERAVVVRAQDLRRELLAIRVQFHVERTRLRSGLRAELDRRLTALESEIARLEDAARTRGEAEARRLIDESGAREFPGRALWNAAVLPARPPVASRAQPWSAPPAAPVAVQPSPLARPDEWEKRAARAFAEGSGWKSGETGRNETEAYRRWRAGR